MSRGHHVPLLSQSLALALVVLFLFFAISISDDLHRAAIATESEGLQKAFKGISTKVGPSNSLVRGVTPVESVAALLPATGLSLVIRFIAGAPSDGFTHNFSGRSPPTLV